MTTVHLFKNHPNKDNIKFVVLPIVTESMLSSCDIGSDIYELEESFKDSGIKLDFGMIMSLPVPQMWQIYNY